jgi:hypothetical protein
VDLLRKVEQALVDIKINGALLVQEAAAAAGVIVGLSFWERVRWSPLFPTSAAPSRSRPRSSGAVGAHGRVAHDRNWPHRHRGDPGAVGRAAGAFYHRDPGGPQTLGSDPIPTPPTAAIPCFVTLRRGRQLVYERNMIDELALRLVHGQLPVGS